MEIQVAAVWYEIYEHRTHAEGDLSQEYQAIDELMDGFVREKTDEELFISD